MHSTEVISFFLMLHDVPDIVRAGSNTVNFEYAFDISVLLIIVLSKLFIDIEDCMELLVISVGNGFYAPKFLSYNNNFD